MSRFRRLLFAVILALTVMPVGAAAQQRSPASRAPVRPLIEGSIAGLLLGFSYVSPTNEAWGVSDGGAVALSVITGIATAYAVQINSAHRDPSETRRPRLRVALGASSGSTLDYELAVRMPTRRRFDTQIAINLSSDQWEKTVFEERCDIFIGCFTGNFIEDARYDQTAAATFGVAVELRGVPAFSPTITFALGPAVTHTERFDHSKANLGGALGELTFGIESPGRSRWTVGAGVRGVTSAAERVVAHVRVGRAFGY